MVTIIDVWEVAPKEATHYSPDDYYTSSAYWKIEGGVVKKVWVEYAEHLIRGGWYEDQGYRCMDYTPDKQPYCDKDGLITRPSQKWIPRAGDTVLYKRTDSLDYAWDDPEEVHVVAVHGSSAWISGKSWGVVVGIEHLQPVPTVKTLESRLYDVVNPEGWYAQPVSTTIRRLVDAGVKLEEET